MTTTMLTKAERRWDWRTWNLLLQIRRATDGEDPRQRHGEMTERQLAANLTPDVRALRDRGWIECMGNCEVFDDNGSELRVMLTWEVTKAGREAMDTAVAAGITIQ